MLGPANSRCRYVEKQNTLFLGLSPDPFQAVDFSILAITLITLLTIQLRSFIIYASTVTKALICLSIWVVPLCTSTNATLQR